MKNWNTLEADVNKWLTKNYTMGRGGKSIDRIVIHHNAGNLTTEGVYSVWQTRAASAHYQVEKSGRIGQLVHDKDTAWHAGVSTVNQVSIGIEHANDTFSPNWTISSATLENGAHLVAALCVYYKLGRPTWGKNLFGHYNYVSTACPGALRYAQGNTYVARAQYWYDQMTGTQPAPTPPATATKPNLGALLRKGSKGTAVTNLQKRLVALGYKLPRYGADGVFGSETDTAVRAFQRDKKLAVDGIVGANTAHALGWTFQGK